MHLTVLNLIWISSFTLDFDKYQVLSGKKFASRLKRFLRWIFYLNQLCSLLSCFSRIGLNFYYTDCLSSSAWMVRILFSILSIEMNMAIGKFLFFHGSSLRTTHKWYIDCKDPLFLWSQYQLSDQYGPVFEKSMNNYLIFLLIRILNFLFWCRHNTIIHCWFFH